ncbi:MAG: tRNA-dihydrouridine synthase, partial [Promicromonosporaceae bacterium]|nr:tRNA-dihydrouridine synthase [Promicromonosporaceae bacterium]
PPRSCVGKLGGQGEDPGSPRSCVSKFVGQGDDPGSPRAADDGLGLYVAEMVMTRAVVERNPRALRILGGETGSLRSAQLYGVDPKTVGEAVSVIGGEGLADHIDLNFGCPVPKITRKGGGGALPWKTQLFAAIVSSAVRAAAQYQIPITVKTRIGIDDSHPTFGDASQVAALEGVAAITLHARTVAQRYSGKADWDKIADLVNLDLGIPIFGNGDVFTAENALEMITKTGCHGVAIGRGAQGRPWLFADLIAAFHGSPLRMRPSLTQVSAVILKHGQLLVEHYGDERRGVTDLRKHIAWYVRGFPVGGEVRHRLMQVIALAELAELLAALPDFDYPAVADDPRGRMGSAKAPNLPHGWLDSREMTPELAKALKVSELEDFNGTADGG